MKRTCTITVVGTRKGFIAKCGKYVPTIYIAAHRRWHKENPSTHKSRRLKLNKGK